MTFSVDSYLEYFLTLLGWIVNNGIFALFVGTGLWLLPLIGVLIKVWREVGRQGDDEGAKGQLLIRWLSLELLPAMLIVVLTLAPTVTVSLNNLQFDVERTKQCGYKVPLKPEETGYSPLVDTFGRRQARIPFWWAMMHKFDKGVNAGMTSILPCNRDLRQMRFEVQREQISDPNLLKEVQQFVSQCYVPARTKLHESQVSLSPAQVRETSWLGGRLLVENSELYPRYRAMQPNRFFEYNPNRDSGLPNTGEGGFPRCNEWWDDSDVGLKKRLLSGMEANFSSQVEAFFSKEKNREEILFRALLRPENLSVSQGKVYPGYGGNVDPTFGNALTRLVGSVGSVASSAIIYPGLDAMRQALPMIHAFMVMGVVILIPIITILSGYSLKTVVTLNFVYFALLTTPFWWELARWLDSMLLDILYGSSAHSSLDNFSLNPYFLENMEDDFIANFVMGFLFLMMPTIWFTAMSWAGFRIGELASHFSKGSQDANQAGRNGGDLVTKVVSKGAK